MIADHYAVYDTSSYRHYPSSAASSWLYDRYYVTVYLPDPRPDHRELRRRYWAWLAEQQPSRYRPKLQAAIGSRQMMPVRRQHHERQYPRIVTGRNNRNP